MATPPRGRDRSGHHRINGLLPRKRCALVERNGCHADASIAANTGKVRRCVMPARGTVLSLIVLLVPRFARRATNGERLGPQPLLRDLDVTRQALPVLARLDPAECLVQAAERFRFALEESEVDGILGARLRVVDDV